MPVRNIQVCFALPRIGDVYLLSAVWDNDDESEVVYHIAIPIMDDKPWWHFLRGGYVPLVVQDTLRTTWSKIVEERNKQQGYEEGYI